MLGLYCQGLIVYIETVKRENPTRKSLNGITENKSFYEEICVGCSEKASHAPLFGNVHVLPYWNEYRGKIFSNGHI